MISGNSLGSNINLETLVQPSSYISVEKITSLDTQNWTTIRTEYITPDSDNFDSPTIPWSFDLTDTETGINNPGVDAGYFRLKADVE